MEANWAVYIAGLAAGAALISSLADVFGLRFHRMGAQGALASASAGLVAQMRLELTTAQKNIAEIERDALKNEKIWDKRLEEETEARKALEDTLEASQKAWEKERAEMRKRIKALEDENAKLREEVAELRKERDDERAKRRALEEALAELQKRANGEEGEKPKETEDK